MDHKIEIPVSSSIRIDVMGDGSVRLSLSPNLNRIQVLGLLASAQLDFEREFQRRNSSPIIPVAPVGFAPG